MKMKNKKSASLPENSVSWLDRLPAPLLWRILNFLTMEDLINLQMADFSLSSLIQAYICSNRTVGFTIASQVMPTRKFCRRFGRLRLPKFLMNLGSRKRSLSESLPCLETLSLFSCVFQHPGSKYVSPIGSFKYSANFSTIETKEVLDKLPTFASVKTLRIDQTELDFLVRPHVFPNLERLFLFLANNGYFPGCILSRYSNWPESKLVLFTYGPKSRPGLKFFPDKDGNPSSDFNTQNLIRFLQTHQNVLETFFWQPFPPKLAVEVFEFVLRMKELKRFGICEEDALKDLSPDRLLKKIQSQMQKPTPLEDRSICPEQILCRNLEYLFLGADSVPDFVVRSLILQNAWTLKTAKFLGCSSLTDETFKVLGHCQHLDTLTFASVPNLSGETLKKILKQRGGNLKTLAVQRCPQLKENLVKSLADTYCSELKQLCFAELLV